MNFLKVEIKGFYVWNWWLNLSFRTRKLVADIRPRFKGRFVTEDQAKVFQEKERIEREKKERQKIFQIEKVKKN